MTLISFQKVNVYIIFTKEKRNFNTLEKNNISLLKLWLIFFPKGVIICNLKRIYNSDLKMVVCCLFVVLRWCCSVWSVGLVKGSTLFGERLLSACNLWVQVLNWRSWLQRGLCVGLYFWTLSLFEYPEGYSSFFPWLVPPSDNLHC